MTGLLVKDFRLLKLQKCCLFVLAVIAISVSVMNENSTFVLGFFPFVMSMLTLSTITYDEFDNGNAFLFTLPVSRKIYAVEKYVLSLVIGVSSWILALIFAVVTNMVIKTMHMKEVVIAAVIILPIILFVYAVMIPFQLKFGGDKSRVAIILAVGILAIASFGIIKIVELFGVDLTKLVDTFSVLSMGILIAIESVVSVIIFVISMMISISIMNKKEF